MTNPLIIIITTAILIWLGFLTFLFVRIFNHYKSLVKEVNGENLEKVLKKLLEKQKFEREELSEIKQQIINIQQKDLKHLQKFGILRFNPFNETGGDNSFSLCLLDGNSDGIVLTGLHTRDKTRMYAKKIENGKSKYYELSKEEQKTIREATN